MNILLRTTITILFISLYFFPLYSQDKVRNLQSNKSKEITKENNDRDKDFKRKYSITAYYNFIKTSNRDYSEGNVIINKEERNSKFGNVSIAFKINKEKHLHVFELVRLNFDKDYMLTTLRKLDPDTIAPVAGATIKMFNLDLRYGYNYKLVNLMKRLNILFEVSSEPYISINNHLPLVATSFPIKEMKLGFRFYVAPKISYDITNRIYFDLEFPIEILDSYWRRSRIENPTLPYDLQTYNKFYFDFFNNIFRFKVGIGVRL